MTINERLFQTMNEKGIKQIDLANALEIKSQLVNNWKTRGTTPPMEYLPKICEVLEISWEYLVTGLEHNTDFSQEEKQLVKEYRKLNMQGQEMLWKQMALLNQVYPLTIEQEEPEEESMIS